MDVVALLSLVVGVVLGVLAALYFDGRYLGQRVREANRQRKESVERLEHAEKALTVAQTANQELESKVAAADAQIEELSRGQETLRAQLQARQQTITATQTEQHTARDNLLRVSERMEALEQERDTLREQLDEARRMTADLQQRLDDSTQTIEALRVENSRTSERLSELLDQLQDQAGPMAQDESAELIALREANQALAQQLDAANARNSELESQVAGALRQAAETQSLRKNWTIVSDKLSAAESRIKELEEKLARRESFSRAVLRDHDRLEIIKGIGPSYARRLNEAGINTLQDLARQTPDLLRELLGIKPWQSGHNPAAWIAEARTLIDSVEG